MRLENKRKRDAVAYRFSPVDDGEDDTDTKHDDHESDSDFIPGKRLCKQQKARRSKKARAHTHHSKTNKPFPFLMLPPELRDLVYEFALCDPSGLHLSGRQERFHRAVRRTFEITVASSWSTGSHSHQNLSGDTKVVQLSPALLATNKQVHSEAIRKLYGRPICVDNTKTLHTFLTIIRPTNRQHLRKVIIQAWGEGHGVHKAMNRVALDLLADCVNIRNLTIKGEFLRWRGRAAGPELARSVYRDAQFFLDTIGALHGRDVALGIIELDVFTSDSRDSFYFGHLVGRRDQMEIEHIKKQYEEEMKGRLDFSLKKTRSK